MASPLISFVVLTRNRREQVLRAIQRSLAQTYSDKEIIAVVNGSTDGTAEAIRSQFPTVKLVVLAENIGAAAGRNRGWTESKGEYVIFLDDDCVLAEDNVAQSVEMQFNADPACGAIAFRIYDPLTNDQTYDLSGGKGHEAVWETVRFCSGAFAARRKALEETHGFCERFFMVNEDTDLALRIMNAGWRIFLRGDIDVYHPSAIRHGTRDLRRAVYFNVRNSLWLAIRTLRVRQWFTLLLPKLWHSFMLAYRSWGIRVFVTGLSDGLRGIGQCFAERRPLSREVLQRARRLRVKLWG